MIQLAGPLALPIILFIFGMILSNISGNVLLGYFYIQIFILSADIFLMILTGGKKRFYFLFCLFFF